MNYIFNFQRRWEDKQRQKEIDFSYVLLCWRKQVFMFLTSLVLKILQENYDFNICRQGKIITSIFATEKKIWLQYFPLRFPLAQLVCQLHCFKWSTKEWDWDLKHICWEKTIQHQRKARQVWMETVFFNCKIFHLYLKKKRVENYVVCLLFNQMQDANYVYFCCW